MYKILEIILLGSHAAEPACNVILAYYIVSQRHLFITDFKQSGPLESNLKQTVRKQSTFQELRLQ